MYKRKMIRIMLRITIRTERKEFFFLKKIMFEQLVDIICNYVEIEQEDIKPESRFMEDLGFTSFDFMSMLGEIEDEMDVEIEQDKAADIRTVGEAVAYLESLK